MTQARRNIQMLNSHATHRPWCFASSVRTRTDARLLSKTELRQFPFKIKNWARYKQKPALRKADQTKRTECFCFVLAFCPEPFTSQTEVSTRPLCSPAHLLNAESGVPSASAPRDEWGV